ncbi:hypothetical protein PAPYR_7690 [Paratrimastix pyriformis]|uniref:Uncharacterized protein n=1 Tax=Paratrimastix pyriformis TaxID=342808 RepID=A0ABQ8UI27_9EUKA|nr:hypothetical protein PAPYR_7690 [Paratrimastix pyriformis]
MSPAGPMPSCGDAPPIARHPFGGANPMFPRKAVVHNVETFELPRHAAIPSGGDEDDDEPAYTPTVPLDNCLISNSGLLDPGEEEEELQQLNHAMAHMGETTAFIPAVYEPPHGRGAPGGRYVPEEAQHTMGGLEDDGGEPAGRDLNAPEGVF